MFQTDKGFVDSCFKVANHCNSAIPILLEYVLQDAVGSQDVVSLENEAEPSDDLVKCDLNLPEN